MDLPAYHPRPTRLTRGYSGAQPEIIDPWGGGKRGAKPRRARAASEIVSLRDTGAWQGHGPVSIQAIMSALRSELDRLGLKRVRLGREPRADWQGAFAITGDGALEIVIGASLDPMKTLHHEVIHALRYMDLFTPKEWTALERAAVSGWIEKHDIDRRGFVALSL